jgi:hypothetical protein
MIADVSTKIRAGLLPTYWPSGLPKGWEQRKMSDHLDIEVLSSCFWGEMWQYPIHSWVLSSKAVFSNSVLKFSVDIYMHTPTVRRYKNYAIENVAE